MRQSAGVRWVALSFGIGEQAVNTRLKQAIEKERPQQLIVVGFAGALDPSLHIGDAARIECVMNQNDIAFNLMTMTTVPEHQSAATPSADHARLLTVNEPLITAKAKQDYRAKTACSMVDMESFHIASLAAQMNIPLQIYRSISDEAKDEIPPEVMRWVKSDGRINHFRALADLATKPRLWSVVKKLNHASQCAAEGLVNALAGVLEV